MSNWTMDEVCMLNERNGGNAICSKTWLSGVPSGQFPPKGNQDAIKKFVQQAYIDCRWKQAAALGGSSPGREARVEKSEKEPRRPAPAAVRAAVNLLDDCGAEPVRTPASKPPQTPAPSVDLLDDSFFNPTPTSAPAPEVTPSSNAFSFVTDSPAAPVPTALGQGGFDPFGFEAVPSAAGFGLDFNSFISSPAPPAQPTCCASPCAGHHERVRSARTSPVGLWRDLCSQLKQCCHRLQVARWEELQWFVGERQTRVSCAARRSAVLKSPRLLPLGGLHEGLFLGIHSPRGSLAIPAPVP